MPDDITFDSGNAGSILLGTYYDFPHSPESLRERSKLRSMRESICGIRWSKLKRENPLLQKYVEIANKALDNFFDGNRSVSRVKPVSVSE